MKNLNKALLSLLLTFLITFSSQGQDAEMADVMRSEGKIYVVVAIILLVLAGLILYLFLLDKKVTNLERMINEKRKTK
ncbi:CcmD family protein [Chryseosolibacter indicus]|uniref:CcmD family protein n=1 Tax=Chryseosolibacter indicus TaxID=2782351 RepID=A0ABS5VUU3_9BACT|nr:CcmD family protein [Chryseosolibacter indicus]MBT1704587.1 CcmD family protein [Chryseosolibacter indicus]